MKRFLLAFLAVLFISSNGVAGGINILSETHHIWGYSGWPVSESYNETSDQPISASARGYVDDGSDMWVTSEASAGDFTLDLVAGLWSASASGESTYVFSADNSHLTLSAFGFTDQTHMLDKALVSLVDLTDSLTIFDYLFVPYWDAERGYSLDHFDFVENIFINSSHLYQLYLYTEATEGDSSSSSSLTVGISSQPVPESGTVVLLGVGLMLFCGNQIRKRRRLDLV